MARLSWLAIAATLCANAAAAPAPLFVRGGFNGWGTADPLVAKGNGVFEARVAIRPGYHGFKLGSADWQVEWTGTDTPTDASADYRLLPHAGVELHLFARQPATYLFRLDARDAAAPRLHVEALPADATPTGTVTDPHRGDAVSVRLQWPSWDGKQERARFSTAKADALLRDYTISSTQILRDPGPAFVRVREAAGDPVTRSGSLAFDALFALANAERHADAVSAIRDGNYAGGAAIACDCFETGEQWHYVWTRDLSYAADLGLALFDPQRVMRSLEFKLSPWRASVTPPSAFAQTGSGLQIIQDTGTGGSWPVSTDRVAWAFGAARVLDLLPPSERSAFAARAREALSNTLEADRVAAFDDSDGLYIGEASFLDWRDQSYAGWIVDDLASLASAKALSTNVAHFTALQLAARLAREQGDSATARKYDGWAAQLKAAINRRFWLADAGLYASLSAGHFDGAALHKFDWLGQSLAIISGIASAEQARSILAHYPHGPIGAPVIFPQQPGQAIYHNRAIWPFVTAYGLRAAAMSGNVAVADAAYATLMREAALNLSNMENAEWLSGQPLLLDELHPALSGPVINSRRQLWSVGAYLGMVTESVFGVHTDAQGLRLQPFITSRLRREQFGRTPSIALRGLRLRGKTIDIRIALPPASAADGYYPLERVTVNGVTSAAALAWDSLPEHSRIVLTMGALQAGDSALRRVAGEPGAASPGLFAPPEPVIAPRADGRLGFGSAAPGVTFNLYRDGLRAASDLPGESAIGATAGCYAAEAVFPQSGNRSHHSRPLCTGTVIDIAAGDARIVSNIAVTAGSAPSLANWGAPRDVFTVSPVTIEQGGVYQLQLRYRNEANQINLGISAGVKLLTVIDADGGRIVARGVVVMPHTRAGIGASTPLRAALPAGRYTLRLDDFYNMSYLQANASFSGAGGVAGPVNRVDLHGIRLLRAGALPPSN